MFYLDVWRECCGYVTFWFGSGSAYPYNHLTDPDPDLFVSGSKMPQKNLF
jgi:hypothetical protein